MKFKVIIGFTLTFVLLLTASILYAQDNTEMEVIEYKGKSDKFALMLSQSRHIEGAIKTAQMLNIEGKGYKFEVVMVGSLAKAIVEDPAMKTYIDTSEQMGIDLSVCAFALKNHGIDEDKVDKRIHIVANAWIHIYELQDAGYNIIHN